MDIGEPIDPASLTDDEREALIARIDADIAATQTEIARIREIRQQHADKVDAVLREFERNGRTSLLVVAQFRVDSEFPSVRRGWTEDALYYAHEQAGKLVDSGISHYAADAMAVLDTINVFGLREKCSTCKHVVQMRGAATCFARKRIIESDADARQCSQYSYNPTE